MTDSRSYPDSVECLIENLIQSSYEYEQAEGSSAKYLRGEFSKAKHALREHIAQLQYETGMYKSLYDNAISGVAQTVKETCIDCGKIEPCDDDCPNHHEVPANDRDTRTGAHLLQMAKSLGWLDDGEGALEFMLRRAREVAFEDCGKTTSLPSTNCGSGE